MEGDAARAAGRTAPLVMLATDGDSTRMIYHALVPDHPGLTVLMEQPISRGTLLRRRLVRLGVLPVVGQVLFMAGVLPILRRGGRPRVSQIMREHALRADPIPDAAIIRVASVNTPEAREALRRLQPRLVLVNGTRIVGAETLRSVPAPFINSHAGITPLYRGVHGGYWALAERRPELVGTTIHRLDEGIDTGEVLEQVVFAPTPADSFATYPYLHTAAAIPALRRVVERALGGSLEARAEPLATGSKLRHHPTAWGYLYRRLADGVR